MQEIVNIYFIFVNYAENIQSKFWLRFFVLLLPYIIFATSLKILMIR